MSRPFPNTFNKDSPITPQSAISYQTNVNRQKTRKWTEAKTVDYGGDDWGDDDDYDLPPPSAKPTGPRQQGQGLVGPSNAKASTVDNSRKYGDLPPLPGASNSRPRVNSFDADDERRDFSSSSNQLPPASNAPATRFSQITGAVAPRNASGPPALSISTQQPAQPPVQISPMVEPPHPDTMTPGPGRVNNGESSMTSPVSETRTPLTSSDCHSRLEFSPSALPPPLSTRASPGPQSATDTTPRQRFPARKSSSSQLSGPPWDEIMGAGSHDATPKPWIGARPASPGTGAKSPISPSKALPFIRPADIYRRAEEERRQSIESSGRPSMDSVMGSRANELPDSPSKPYAKGGPEISGVRRTASIENDDISDSGRRPMPMLEPVEERKSEYGFKGFNANDHSPQQGHSQFPQQTYQSQNLDVEDTRRQSISPKLPDLGRMSGFGMDMFSAKDVEAISKEPETSPTTAALSSPEQDLKLRNQPSFGFKSVVHQAFDHTDDNSLPDTPASGSGSGVKRTDSESTGTGGISPIMSRATSSAVPETRTRDISTPVILEAAEPDSPETAGTGGSPENAFDAPQAPGFKPGHRRDISTPSPGNSPARTPDLATTYCLPGSQHGRVEHDTSASHAAEEPLQGSRPFAEREHSFRPSLPGGWTSYATTARSETPTQPAVETPVTEITAAHDDDDYDLTPTTTKRYLPPIPIAGATLGGAALGSHDHTSPSEPPLNQAHRPAFGGIPSSSPRENMYPPQPLESSLPLLDRAPAETQLRPHIVDRPVSTQSIPPLPPPKDTPTGAALSGSLGYFPKPATSMAEKTQESPEAEEDLSQSSTKPEIIPTTSTESADYNEGKVMLRKEIVKTLTPTPSNANAHTSSAVSDRMGESSLNNSNLESYCHPSEYDNYWATTDQDEESRIIPEVHKDGSDGRPSTASTGHPGLESPIPAPLSPRRADESLHPPRSALQSRFSWEQSSEDVSAGVNHDRGYLATDTSGSGSAASEFPDSIIPVEDEKQIAPQSPELKTASSPYEEEHHGTRDAALTYTEIPVEKSRRLSLAEERDPRVSSNPLSPTPPEDEHPSRSSQQNFPTSPDFYRHSPAPPSTVSPVASVVHPFAPPPTTTGRLIAFREIVAMKSPQERIKTFDETRHRFASMDSGLKDWILNIRGQFPDEHGGVTGSWGNSRPSGSARGKFSKAPTVGPAPPLQQPYYQQYLNASSPPTPSMPESGVVRPGPSMPSDSQQGFSSAGNKITTQQVQAKGKELLHTAGIFGGKAGKAGKGLLAKGKNKFRAAGGGDKTSPPLKADMDRRSSWGFPLPISKSSGRPDAMSRNSRESTPTSTLGHRRTNTNTTSSERGSPAVQLLLPAGHSLGVMSGALSSEHPELPSRESEISTTQPIPLPSQITPAVLNSETRNTLGAPVTIGKNQPSWGLFDATPIVEEDGFYYEERSQAHLLSDPSRHPDGLSVPADNLVKSDSSNSSDVPFYDAHENSVDINNDWVMVSPEPEGYQLGGGTSVLNSTSNPDQTVRQSLGEPSLSILDRTRGSFSQGPSPQMAVRKTGDADFQQSIDGESTTSILSRPRGSFSCDTPATVTPAKPMTPPFASPTLSYPSQASHSVPRPVTPPAPNVMATPVSARRTPSPQKPTQAQTEKQSGISSLLPPIRRTSMFGIGFRSRQPKQRFAIEEDDETSQPRVSGSLQHAIELSRIAQLPKQGSDPSHSRAFVGAAVGAAALAGIASHGKRSQGDEVNNTRAIRSAEEQRPLSFHRTSAKPVSSQKQPTFVAESDVMGPLDDTNTWGVCDEVPQNTIHTPRAISSGKQRQPSLPPPGFVSDPAPLRDDVSPQQSRVEPVSTLEPEELSPRDDDTNTWGVHDELPPNTIHPRLPIVLGKQRQSSFPPPGFAVDPEAHGPPHSIQPVNARSPASRQPLTVDTSSSYQWQALIRPPLFKFKPQAHGPADAIRGVNLTDEAPRTPAHNRANSNDPAPRPFSFQRTPPRESSHQSQPSLPFSFTREPEEIGSRAGNAGEGDSTQGSDPQRHLSVPPPAFARDLDEGELSSPPRSPQRLSFYALLQQNTPQRDPSKAMFTPARADNILQSSEFQESQVEWRPNRPRVVTKPSQSSYSSESLIKEMGISAARTNSWDTQPPPRRYSGSSSSMQCQESQFSEKGGWPSPQQSKPIEQPPSSAQRYPELFKPGQRQSVVESPRDADLPAQYYQAPISRTQAFLPRQQTNEYQLPGVGPPEEPVSPSRHNSGFLRDIGGRFSRNPSRERRNSRSRYQDRLSPERGLESRGEYADSSVMSEDSQEQKKSRASFFGHLNRNSNSGQSLPRSRDSITAHHAGSKSDLLVTPQLSPIKRSFFGGSSSEQKSTPRKLTRHGTMDSTGKKKEKNRFSALGGFFGKPSPAKTPVEERPQASRELSQGERQPIESPQLDQQQERTPSKYATPEKVQAYAESQSRRGLLSKFSASVTSPRDRGKEKSRRPSATGLLNGFMGRKFQMERGRDDSRSQGSQPPTGQQPLLSQTYTDLQEAEVSSQRQRPESPFQRRQSPDQQYQQQQVQSRSQSREIPFQDSNLIHQDRGRRGSREPQYDSVPIPGGYSLVRGQGAIAVPTEYDPRGLSRLQQSQQQQKQVDPRFIKPQAHAQDQIQPQTQYHGLRLSYQSAYLALQPQGQGKQQTYPEQPQPELGALKTYRDFNKSMSRISREDVLARSPPKPLIDQQRPYQISLPGGEIEDDEDVVSTSSRSPHPSPYPNSLPQTNPNQPTSAPRNLQHDTIIRLQQPILRHPESPAGYSLPEDTRFSPVNPKAVDFPSPSPPKWPSHLDARHRYQAQYQGQGQGHDRHTSLSTSYLDVDGDLDRSNTGRTAVSALSGISATRSRSGTSLNGSAGLGGNPSPGGLNAPQEELGMRGGVGVRSVRSVSPIPTPPSPPDGDGDSDEWEKLRRTEVALPPRASTAHLYRASRRLPRSGGAGFGPPSQASNGHVHAHSNGQVNGKKNSVSQNGNGHAGIDADGNERGIKHLEEKILYDQTRPHLRVGQDGPVELEDHATSMSATSYPGQEWNPFAMGAWDDGDDVGPPYC